MNLIHSMSSTLEAELAAIREGAALAPITDRAFLRITGADATRWLNGMVTNNIKDLAPGEGNYNFLLNAQGRIQGDCTIYREPTPDPVEYILETDKSQIDRIEQTLDRFIIMDDVQLAQILYTSFPIEAKAGLLLVGKNAGEQLLRAVVDTWERPLTTSPLPGSLTFGGVNGEQFVIIAPPHESIPSFELWFSSALEVELVVKALLKAGASNISPEALGAHRILSGTPKYGQDIRDTETARDLPQETAQNHALHFAKGCYLGQEIVERIRSRGQVHRTFMQFRLTGSLPELPAKLEANGKPAGELTSAVQIGDEIVALGYARREALETHQPLTYPGGTAEPRT